MEAGSVELPAGECETPVTTHKAGLIMGKNDDDALENGDNVANVQQHAYLCVDQRREVEAIVTLSSSSSLDEPVIPQSCDPTEGRAIKFNALSEILEAGCPVASEKAGISGEQVPATEELLQEQPEQAIKADFENEGQERRGSGVESNEEYKDNHELFESKHQEDSGPSELSSLLVEGEQLGLGTGINDDVENEDQESDGELYEDAEDNREHVLGSMYQENTDEQSSPLRQIEQQGCTSPNKTEDESVVERPVVELGSRALVEEEELFRTEESNDNLDLMIGDDDAGRKSKRNTVEAMYGQMKVVLEDVLEVLQKDSNVLDSDKDDSLEKQEAISSEAALSDPTGLPPQVTGSVMGTDDDTSNSLKVEESAKIFELVTEQDVGRVVFDLQEQYADVTDDLQEQYPDATDDDTSNFLEVEEGAKTVELVHGQDSGDAGTSCGNVVQDLQKQYPDLTKTIGDAYKRESHTEDAPSTPQEPAIESESANVVVSQTVELPLGVKDCPKPIEHVHTDSGSNLYDTNGNSDASLLQELQEGECNTVICEVPSVAVKQAISSEKEVDLLIHCNAGAPEVCQSSLESLKADESETVEAGSLCRESLDSQSSAEIQTHEDSFQSEVKLPSHRKEGATSTDQQFQQGFHHDKDGGSSLDSTAGSSWKLCETEPPMHAFEEANSSGSEDSASSPAHSQPSAQQRKKRIDLSHQFVRKIVKIQHDREQYDREQYEKQSQAQQVASLAHQAARSIAIQDQRNNVVEKRQVRKSPGKEFIHRRPSERGSERYMKELQPTHDTKGKRNVPAQAKSASTLLRERYHEGNLQGRVTFAEAEGPLEGNQPEKIGRSKHDRFVPIYRPPSARESLAPSFDEQNNVAESEFPNCSFIVNNSPDSSTNSVLESPVPSLGVTKVGEDKGMLTVVKSSSGERYVHYVESQGQQTTLKGMSIKVTFDTERQQRHIAFSDVVEPARQQNHREKMSPSSFDYNPGLDCCPGFDLNRSPDTNSVLGQSPLSSFQLGSSPAHSQGKVGSSGTSSSTKGKFTQQTERGTPSTPFHVPRENVSPSIPFQLQVDKRSHRRFEGKHAFSEQADIPVKLQEPYSWFPEASSVPMHLSTGGTIHGSYGGKMRRGAQSSREVLVHNSSTQIPGTAVISNSGHSWSISHRRERPSDGGDNESINQRMTSLIPQFDCPFAEMMNSDMKGKPKTAAAIDNRSKDKRQSKSKNILKDYTLPFTSQVEAINATTYMVSSPSHLASDIFQSEHEAKGEKQHKVHSPYDVNQRNTQESIESGRGLWSDNTRKGSTQISKPHLSPLSVEGSTLHTTCLLGKWGDIVDDSPDAYDYLQMKVEDETAEGAEGPESRGRTYNYGSPHNSDFSDVANSKNEKVMSKGSSKYRGMRNHGFSDNNGQQQNKAAGEVVQNIFGHPVNENRARRSVWERLGPQNVSGPSILGPPPRVLDDRDTEKACSDAFSSKTSRSFEYGVQGSELDSHGLGLSSVSHDSPYNGELDAFRNDECTEVVVQAYKDSAQKRSKRELYVPRRGL